MAVFGLPKKKTVKEPIICLWRDLSSQDRHDRWKIAQGGMRFFLPLLASATRVIFCKMLAHLISDDDLGASINIHRVQLNFPFAQIDKIAFAANALTIEVKC